MKRLSISLDADLSHEIHFDWPTSNLVVLDWFGNEVARFSMADTLLELERVVSNPLSSYSLLHDCTRPNLQHRESSRAEELRQRRIAAFRRWSHAQLTGQKDV